MCPVCCLLKIMCLIYFVSLFYESMTESKVIIIETVYIYELLFSRFHGMSFWPYNLRSIMVDMLLKHSHWLSINNVCLVLILLHNLIFRYRILSYLTVRVGFLWCCCMIPTRNVIQRYCCATVIGKSRY
jgi:hypothetical protein